MGDQPTLRPLADSEDPRIGMVLQDRYEIVRKLGTGGMGAVYEGRHLMIRKRVAIKLLHVQYATNALLVKRFHREAVAASEIGHPNIVDVTDMGQLKDGTAFMVLEYLDGSDWGEILDREGPQPVGSVVRVMSQVCDALEAAHDKGIVHRDLKPENLYLIDRPGQPRFVKVLDFGISKVKETGALTVTGEAIGTAFYMPPEQATGDKSIDHRADLYAMGVIMFYALTGQFPHMDEAFPMLMMKICVDPAPPVAELRPDLPPEFAAIVDKLLEKSPDDRYQSCAELRAALEPFRGLMDPPSPVRERSSVSSELALAQTALPGAAPPGEGLTNETAARRPAVARWLALGFAAVCFTGLGAWVASPDEPQGHAPTPTEETPAAPVATEVGTELVILEAPPGLDPAVVRIVSMPQGAEVMADGQSIGVTPLDVAQPTGAEAIELTVAQRGYETQTVRVDGDSASPVLVELRRAPRRARPPRGPADPVEDEPDDPFDRPAILGYPGD